MHACPCSLTVYSQTSTTWQLLCCVILTESALQFPNVLHSLTHSPHSHTHTHQDPQVPPLLVVWCTPGGGGPHVLTLLEHSYCMLEGQLEALIILKKEEEQTTSVYQNNHSTETTLLGYRMHEHICTGLNMRLESMLMALFTQSFNTISHVQCVTLQHEELL